MRLPLPALDAVGVVIGPGSWTGIQVALGAAKSLAMVNGAVIIPISRLELMARSRPPSSHSFVAAIIDAGHDRAYGGLYRFDSRGRPETLLEARANYRDWNTQLASLPDECVVITEQRLPSLIEHPKLQLIHADFEPREGVLRDILATGSSMAGDARFHLEPLFLCDPSPRAWQPRA
jgi:tRNA A37 threonylcarbamoyladenosine modification protein TsaB